MLNRNIILITAECVRNDIANSISFLNNSDHEIKRYENTFSVGCWTIPSILSILTSTYPLMHDGKLRVTLPRVSLAEILLKEGYNTIAINNHPYLTRDRFGNGFKSYNQFIINPGETGILTNLKTKLVKYLNSVADFFTKHLKKYLLFEKLSKYAKIFYYKFITDYDDSDQYLTELIIEKSSRSERPFFIWAHFMGPHSPYYPQREYEFSGDMVEKIFDVNNKLTRARNVFLKGKNGLIHEKFSEDEIDLLKELYVYELKILEKNLLNLLDYLKDNGLLENTHVIITADHGEEFYEHERYHHEYHLYDELIHVPLYIVGGDIDGGKEDNMVSHIDIAPTILDLASIEKPRSFEGESILNHVRDYVISETSNITTNVDVSVIDTIKLINSKISVRNGEWKYIFNMMDESDELYNIKKDEFEENNLCDDHVPEGIKNVLFKHIELILKTSKIKLRQ